MKKQEVERIYTQQVAQLLNQGWRVHASTMPGHQGEIAHIDLTDGTEIRRVLLNRETAWSHLESGFSGDKLEIIVGRNTDVIRPGWDATLWNNHLEILSQIGLAEIQEPNRFHPDGWYTDFGEAARISRIRKARRAARRTESRAERGDAFKSIALRWLRRQPRMKSLKLEDITEMFLNQREDGRITYIIEAKGKRYELRARAARRSF